MDWSPVTQAHPVEWVMQAAPGQPPYAVIRLIGFGDPSRPELFYRVVTWAPASDGRRLLGYCRSLTEAAELAWDFKLAYASLRHHVASRRGDISTLDALAADPAELVRFFREQQRNTDSERRTG